MKGTDHFKRTIYMYLEQRAEEDALFAKKYRNPAKNMDECVTHILNYVQKSGCNGFTDGEIFGQARCRHDRGVRRHPGCRRYQPDPRCRRYQGRPSDDPHGSYRCGYSSAVLQLYRFEDRLAGKRYGGFVHHADGYPDGLQQEIIPTI